MKKMTNLKKIIALVLVAVACLALFSACSKQEAKQPEFKSFNIYNRSGEKITSLKITNDKGTSSVATENVEDGLDFEMKYQTTTDGAKLQIEVEIGLAKLTVSMGDDVTDITILPEANVDFSKPEDKR